VRKRVFSPAGGFRSIALLALAAACRSAAPEPTEPAGPRSVFVLEVDRALARDQVWRLQDASDEEVVAVAMNAVRRRLRAMDFTVVLQREPGTPRFQVSLPAVGRVERELLTSMLRSIGLCELFFVADEASARARGIDLASERARLDSWRAQNPGHALERFNTLEPDAGGPARDLAWITAASNLERSDLGWPVLLPHRPADCIGATSFVRVWPATDARGEPALGFELRPSRKQDLARITAEHVGSRLAVVLLGRLVSAPEVKPELVDTGVLEGRFAAGEVERYARTIQELRSPLTVVSVR